MVRECDMNKITKLNKNEISNVAGGGVESEPQEISILSHTSIGAAGGGVAGLTCAAIAYPFLTSKFAAAGLLGNLNGVKFSVIAGGAALSYLTISPLVLLVTFAAGGVIGGGVYATQVQRGGSGPTGGIKNTKKAACPATRRQII